MLSNPTFELIGQRPVRPADQTPNVAFCIALMSFDDRIEKFGGGGYGADTTQTVPLRISIFFFPCERI